MMTTCIHPPSPSPRRMSPPPACSTAVASLHLESPLTTHLESMTLFWSPATLGFLGEAVLFAG